MIAVSSQNGARTKTTKAPRERLVSKESNTTTRRRRMTVTQRLPETLEALGCS